jgi:hypothetical protein
MNPKEACMDVGFYFGRASGHSLTRWITKTDYNIGIANRGA